MAGYSAGQEVCYQPPSLPHHCHAALSARALASCHAPNHTDTSKCVCVCVCVCVCMRAAWVVGGFLAVSCEECKGQGGMVTPC